MAPSFSIPLPRGWRGWVKQALLHAVGLERLALAEVRAGFESGLDPRADLVSSLDRAREEATLMREENRILRARLGCIPASRRPHYPAAERLSILVLRAKAGWNGAETAHRFLLTADTIASWMRRLDERGPEALVQTPVPVNRYEDVVTLLAQKLHQAAPSLGRRKLADVLARAGVKLAASTVGRMLKRKPPPAPPPKEPNKVEVKPSRVVTARETHHVWHVDLTACPTGLPGAGFWAPWWPFALVLRWALSFHVGLVLDHFSRALVAFAVFRKEPTAAEVCAFLDRTVEKAGRAPRYIVTDQGSQFQGEYLAWCEKNGVRPRFGAVGKHGSIAVIERFILSLKKEFLRKILVPLHLPRVEEAVGAYQLWYNTERPHESLGGWTPHELQRGVALERETIRREPRARVPLARGDPGERCCQNLELIVSYVDGHKELPVVRVRQAA